MRAEIIDAPFAQMSRHWQPCPFTPPDIDFIMDKSRRYFHTRPNSKDVRDMLDLNEGGHIANWVDPGQHVVLAPLRPAKTEGPLQIEEVRSYGRGYVMQLNTSDTVLHIAVKGAGISGWARDNLEHLIQENQHRGVRAGAVPDEGGIKDIVGEYRVRQTGAQVPRTAFITQSDRLYQIGRHWENPYRIWELTSAPFRFGPDVSQTIALLNWPIELRHALVCRDKIAARAARCLRLTGEGSAQTQMARAQTRVTDTLARLAAADLGLSAWTFHLANIAYSGESSGYDRVLEPGGDAGLFMLGILGAEIESWAAINWLRAVCGLPLTNFDTWHAGFVAQVRNHDLACRFLRSVRPGKPTQAFDGFDGTGAGFGYNGLAFVRRNDGDVAAYCDAIFTFQTGLRDIFEGKIAALGDLERWEAAVDLHRLDQIRIAQSLSGQHAHEQRDRYRMKLRQNLDLQRALFPLYAERAAALR